MLELFIAALEDELGLLVRPPLAPVARMEIIMNEVSKLTHAAELHVHSTTEQNGASELVCTFDNDGGGVDIDVLKKMLRGKHGWLTAKPFANGSMQLSMMPHSKRSAVE